MNTNSDFSLDISVDPSQAFKPLPDLVTFDLCRAYPMQGGNLLLHNARNGKRAVVMPEVYAALAYYYDHRLEMDAAISEGEALVEALRQCTPSKLARKLYER